MQPPRTGLGLKARALRWLAQRDHSRIELRGKLLRAAPDAGPEEVDALLDELQARGHLDEARFVESRLHARQARFGNRRIVQELAQHGLVPDAAQQAELQASERARVEAAWRRKYGSLHPHADGAACPDGSALEADGEGPSNAHLSGPQLSQGRASASFDPATQQRQMRFLIGRGFSPEVVRQWLREAARSFPGTSAGASTAAADIPATNSDPDQARSGAR